MGAAFASLAGRLAAGRPLLLGGDVGASLRQLGASIAGAGALGRLARERPDAVEAHYAVELDAGVDILTTLTSDTTPRALAQVGMAYRAAAITAAAVDLALEAAERAARPVAVAGVLGGDAVAPVDVATLVEEHATHAARLAAAGSDLILARGMASRTELMAAVIAASNTQLPTWAVLEVDLRGEVLGGEPPTQVIHLLETSGASAILFDVRTADAARLAVGRAREAGTQLPLGVLLDAGASCIEGYPEGASDPEEWAATMMTLLPLGARALGGGRGCTQAHTAALARMLRREMPSLSPSLTETVEAPAFRG